MPFDDIVQKGQAAPFAAQRAFAYARKVGILVVAVTVEHCHNALIFHLPILHDGVEDDVPVHVYILQFVPRNVLQKGRHGEYGSCREPSAHVVARHVVEHRVVGYVEDVVLQLLQVAYTHHGCVGMWVAEDEVAKAHVLFQQLAQVAGHGL